MRTHPVHYAFTLILLVAVFDAGAQDRPGRGVMESRIDQFVTNRDATSGFGSAVPDDQDPARLTDSDRAFLTEAHQLEMLHVHAGTVALKQHTTQAVQSHARRVLVTHQASLVAIEKIARDHDQELERRFTPEYERKAEALSQATGTGFGGLFFGQMLELHARTVALYERASEATENADLRSLVDDSLPTLRTQLADAEQFSTVGAR